MAKKAKEQVRYNASITPEKRVRLAGNAITSASAKFAARLFIIGMILVFSVLWFTAPISSEFFEADDNDFGAVMCVSYTILFGYVAGLLGKIDTNYYNIKQMRGMGKGCTSPAEVICSMPTTRLAVHKSNFKCFAWSTILPAALFNIVLNLYAFLFSDGRTNFSFVVDECDFTPLKSSIGFMSLIFALLMICVYELEFCTVKLSEKMNKAKAIIRAVIMFSIMWITILEKPVLKLANMKIFENFSGIAGICLCTATIVFIFCKEKLIYEKRLVNAPWFE